ncbi:MAG: hypothetical protein AB7Y46_17575 [Armatimonadota bacterium]
MAAQPGGSVLEHIPGALWGPFPIVVALATIAGSIFLTPLILIPGAAAWLIAVAVTAGVRAYAQRPAAIDIRGLPPSIRRDLEGVNQALADLHAAIEAVPVQQRVLFADVEQEAREVRDAVVRMAVAAGSLHSYLASHPAEQMQAQLALLRGRLESAVEPAVRAEIEAAIASAEARLARREQLMAMLQRYRATLTGLQASAQELAGRAVKLTAGADLAADAAFGEDSAARRISELKASVAALEEVMEAETETA